MNVYWVNGHLGEHERYLSYMPSRTPDLGYRLVFDEIC